MNQSGFFFCFVGPIARPAGRLQNYGSTQMETFSTSSLNPHGLREDALSPSYVLPGVRVLILCRIPRQRTGLSVAEPYLGDGFAIRAVPRPGGLVVSLVPQLLGAALLT